MFITRLSELPPYMFGIMDMPMQPNMGMQPGMGMPMMPNMYGGNSDKRVINIVPKPFFF
jgi:hypothetical protein